MCYSIKTCVSDGWMDGSCSDINLTVSGVPSTVVVMLVLYHKTCIKPTYR